RKLGLQRLRFQMCDVALDARLLALDLNVGWLAREAGFGELLVISNELLIESALPHLEVFLLLKRSYFSVQAWKLLLQGLGFLSFGLLSRRESALLSIADLGQAGRIDGKARYIRKIYAFITVLLGQQAGPFCEKRRAANLQKANTFVHPEQIRTHAT